MFRIAICDDDLVICEQIEKNIVDFKITTSKVIETEVFYSGEELCEFIRSGNTFDLIILDIELKNINGIEVGRRLRQELNDEVTQILYISAKQSYAMELFDNRPLTFLIKPLNEEKIIKNIEQAIIINERGNLFFEFKNKSTFYKIPYKEIMYFESDNKKVNVIAVNKIYEFYGKLSDVIKIVPSLEFIYIHKSYLVNYMYIRQSQYDTLLLANGVNLPISQPFRKEVRGNLMNRRKGGK